MLDFSDLAPLAFQVAILALITPVPAVIARHRDVKKRNAIRLLAAFGPLIPAASFVLMGVDESDRYISIGTMNNLIVLGSLCWLAALSWAMVAGRKREERSTGFPVLPPSTQGSGIGKASSADDSVKID